MYVHVCMYMYVCACMYVCMYVPNDAQPLLLPVRCARLVSINLSLLLLAPFLYRIYMCICMYVYMYV